MDNSSTPHSTEQHTSSDSSNTNEALYAKEKIDSLLSPTKSNVSTGSLLSLEDAYFQGLCSGGCK